MTGLLSRKIDYADLYLEYVTSEALNLEEGLVKNASRNIAQGVGVRAIAGDKTGYAYSDEVFFSISACRQNCRLYCSRIRG